MGMIHIYVLILYIIQGVCIINGLTIDKVSLSDNKTHLRLQEDENGLLECHYTLDEGEIAKAITWYHDDFMALKWAPPQPAEIGEGLGKGDAVLSRQDGNLEFRNIKLDLAGKYRCEVMTSQGKTFKSFEYQLLVVDMPEGPNKAKHSVDNCKINFSFDSPAIKPRPQNTCGVWSAEHGYILKAASWLATPYYNGSVAYSLEEEEFQISQMPLDAVIKCEIKMTKIDRSEIVLLEKNYNFTEVWERGCYPLEVDKGVELIYDNNRLTCHAEITSVDTSFPVTAKVNCKENYVAKYPDFVTSVNLVCNGMKWEVESGLTWNHFDNLICEEMSSSTLPPRPPTSHLRNSEDDNTSTGTPNFTFPPSFLLLLGLLRYFCA